jgi:hypothetical protein
MVSSNSSKGQMGWAVLASALKGNSDYRIQIRIINGSACPGAEAALPEPAMCWDWVLWRWQEVPASWAKHLGQTEYRPGQFGGGMGE